MTALEMRNDRAKLIEQARDLSNKAGATPEDHITAGKMLDQSDVLKTQIDTAERGATLFAELGHEIGRRSTVTAGASAFVSNAARDKKLFNKIVHGKGAALRDEDKDYAADTVARDARIFVAMASGNGAMRRLSEEDQAHFSRNFQNAGSTGTNSAGGYTIAPLFEAELLVALKAFGGMRAVARHITTDTGASLPWPTMDDTSNQATIVGENTTLSADTDLTLGQKTIGSFTYVSGYLPVSLQLLQDSAFDFGGIVEAAIVNRFGRKQNADFTTGAGTTLPFGVVVGAASGTVGATGQTTSIIYDDFVNLIHSVDPAYRDGARFMFHDNVLKSLKLLKDTQGRPLFVPSITAGAPDTIAGYPFTINQQMAVPAANAKSVLFGNFVNYIVRDTLGMQMMVLRERFADSLQVAWLAFMRSDGKLVSAGSPIKYYANSAS